MDMEIRIGRFEVEARLAPLDVYHGLFSLQARWVGEVWWSSEEGWQRRSPAEILEQRREWVEQTRREHKERTGVDLYPDEETPGNPAAAA